MVFDADEDKSGPARAGRGDPAGEPDRPDVGHWLACGEDLPEVVESDTDATGWECPACGVILGVTGYGV